MERVTGYAPEELVGTVNIDMIHPDDLERVVTNAAADFSRSFTRPGILLFASEPEA